MVQDVSGIMSLMIFDLHRSLAGHPPEDRGQRLHSLPGESGAGLSSTVQPDHRERAQQDLQHPDWSVYLSGCLPVYLFTCLFIYLCVYLSVYLLVYLSVCSDTAGESGLTQFLMSELSRLQRTLQDERRRRQQACSVAKEQVGRLLRNGWAGC